MQAYVFSNIKEAKPDDFIGKTAIVIDVLRATSTIIAALENGCSSVVPVETVEEARSLQRDGDVLGGERFCRKIAGFHLGNSPLEYASPIVQDKRLVLTTTNGTRGIRKAAKASNVLAGALLNAEACAKSALALDRDIAILCAGTNDSFSLEDGLCAGLLLQLMEDLSGGRVRPNEFGEAMMLACGAVRHRLEETLLASPNGRRLAGLGYRDDVAYCAGTNVSELVPILRDGAMIRF